MIASRGWSGLDWREWLPDLRPGAPDDAESGRHEPGAWIAGPYRIPKRASRRQLRGLQIFPSHAPPASGADGAVVHRIRPKQLNRRGVCATIVSPASIATRSSSAARLHCAAVRASNHRCRAKYFAPDRFPRKSTNVLFVCAPLREKSEHISGVNRRPAKKNVEEGSRSVARVTIATSASEIVSNFVLARSQTMTIPVTKLRSETYTTTRNCVAHHMTRRPPRTAETSDD